MLVQLDYVPRDVFKPYHSRKERWACLVAHRRAGKTVACVIDLIDHCLRCPLERPRVAYIAPYYKQAKSVAWDYVKNFSRQIPGAVVNESDLRVDYPNGGRIKLYGADDPDALRGMYFDAVVLDEYADMRPRFFPEVIRPALADRKGLATFIGTPKGRNEFYELYTLSQEDKDWFSAMLRASETGLVDQDELESARKTMSENQYAQEFECSFEAAIEGAYYGAAIEKAEREGRIGNVPHRPDLPVYTGWDLGVGDDTSIWFLQRVGGVYHIIDHYATNGQPASHYVDIVDGRPYKYAAHYLPHDAKSREWASGRSRLDTLKALGLKNIKIVPKINVDDGINAVRNMMAVMYIDKVKCAEGLESLRQYRREFDENKRTFKPTPLHDWASHDADAMRYLCLGLEPEAAPVSVPKYEQGRRKWKSTISDLASWITA